VIPGKARYDDGFIVVRTRTAIVAPDLCDGNDGESYYDGL